MRGEGEGDRYRDSVGLHAPQYWRVYLAMGVDRERPSPNLNKLSVARSFRWND